MTILKQSIVLFTFVCMTFGCAGVKPYEKEYLLNPLMDDQSLQSLSSDFTPTCTSQIERLSMNGVGSGNSSSCPTCGG